ncbi:hypothetical protein [Saccharolobus islandicus]|uniref:Uncharacterized protein n=6 Tax=Saccharolobus islandicus TaxID=43080 RepID=M9U7X5_SACIS|nr:hypothetical protein [Sulfolobus islandicus]ACP37521.1 hypothetical protein M1425_2808 [Sulfolobus islandicus M.14.25]ACP54664.1 hypothetical protein M1627_2908 [Sulfolobus islandicus M.16.27]ACR41344.1 hypothetical protein M164_0727 [Sulfolobus islandicus M.16.4]ADX81997.1 hypothetical protein SiH_0640 [Sulfolobus islandicus HVE10/4]ADX84776.1 hypothetical protein SiRe_0694 [Sulfolobus islandicus REY15A]
MYKRKMTEQVSEIQKDLRKRAEFVIKAYKKYFDALAEFDKTGILKVNGEVLYVSKRDSNKD